MSSISEVLLRGGSAWPHFGCKAKNICNYVCKEVPYGKPKHPRTRVQGPFIALKRAIFYEELPVYSTSHWHAPGQWGKINILK